MAADSDIDGPRTPIRQIGLQISTRLYIIIMLSYFYHETLLSGAMCPSYLFSGVGIYALYKATCTPLIDK